MNFDEDKNELTIVEVLDDKVEFSTNTNQRITSVLIGASKTSQISDSLKALDNIIFDNDFLIVGSVVILVKFRGLIVVLRYCQSRKYTSA